MNFDVSVIIISHEENPLLLRALKSLKFDSSNFKLQIVLVENGWDSSESEIISNYINQNNNICSVRISKLSIADARNIGIENSLGTYIGFLDSDDYVESNMFSLLFNYAIKKNADICMCDYFIENNSTLEIRKEGIIAELLNEKMFDGKKIIGFMLGQKGRENQILNGSVWRCLYKNNFIKRKGIRFPANQNVGEDLVFNIDAFLHAENICFYTEALYHYVIHANSVSHKIYENRWMEYDNFLWSIIHKFKKYNLISEYRWNLDYKIRTISSWIACEYAESDCSIGSKYKLLMEVSVSRNRLLYEIGMQSEISLNRIDKYLNKNKIYKIIIYEFYKKRPAMKSQV